MTAGFVLIQIFVVLILPPLVGTYLVVARGSREVILAWFSTLTVLLALAMAAVGWWLFRSNSLFSGLVAAGTVQATSWRAVGPLNESLFALVALDVLAALAILFGHGVIPSVDRAVSLPTAVLRQRPVLYGLGLVGFAWSAFEIGRLLLSLSAFIEIGK